MKIAIMLIRCKFYQLCFYDTITQGAPFPLLCRGGNASLRFRNTSLATISTIMQYFDALTVFINSAEAKRDVTSRDLG